MNEKFHEESDLVLAQYEVTEQKWLPRTNDMRTLLTSTFRDNATDDIRQIYLSHPSEQFSLWLSEHTNMRKSVHRASLKTRGEWTADGLFRREFPGYVDNVLFDKYDQDVPAVTKARVRPHKGVIIDFFDDGHVHAESFHPNDWEDFKEQYGFGNEFTDVTMGDIANNEWRAHNQYRRDHGGREAHVPRPVLDVDKVTRDVFTVLKGDPGRNEPVIVQIGGRSGSGKSFFIRELQKALQSRDVESIVMSTDDYNYGKEHLYGLANQRGEDKWVNYDSDEVYDLGLFKSHVEALKSNINVPKFHFDHEPEARLTVGTLEPAEVIIFEGIKAGHPDFNGLAHLSYEVPTPLATSLGRRCMRDLRERPRFAKPRHNLEYYLRYAELAYRMQLS